ncbi:MAG: MBL fold metallo-hydrolase [Methanosarcinales archaeon]|nr:MBL fold metallo-hydrolase [Methanosarcinales archaeon]
MEKEKQVATQRSAQEVQLQNGDKEVSNVENLKIKHYWYNAFIIQNDKVKIAIDPGQNLYLFSLGSLIPKSEWSDITHILVTHGDPDHHYQTDRVAEASGAPVICGKDLVKRVGSEMLLLSPRDKRSRVLYDTPLEKVYPLDVGEAVDLKEFQVKGLKAVHGPIKHKLFGLIKLEIKTGPGERIGLGGTGFEIKIDNKVIVNLGDSLLQKEWEGLKPDILMIPIGGQVVKNTMGVEEALEAVKLISPKKVIPTHYNCGALLWRNLNSANPDAFKNGVKKMGIECIIMKDGDEILV